MKTPSTKDPKLDRKHLGPTGPANIEPEPKQSYEDKHPNPGNVESHVGPTPTDDPDSMASELKREVDKKRAQAPPD